MCVCAKLNFLARCKKRAELIGTPTKKPGRPRRPPGGGGGEGEHLLADYARGGQFPLADYVRGEKICGGTESAPTT